MVVELYAQEERKMDLVSNLLFLHVVTWDHMCNHFYRNTDTFQNDHMEAEGLLGVHEVFSDAELSFRRGL